MRFRCTRGRTTVCEPDSSRSPKTYPHVPSFRRTTLSNEEIIAELGWTKEIIKAVIGVTPTTMRPPYGGEPS